MKSKGMSGEEENWRRMEFWERERRKTRSSHMTERSTVGRITFLQHVPIYKTNVDCSFICVLWGAEQGMREGGRSRSARHEILSDVCVQRVKHSESETVASSQTEERLLSEWTGRHRHNQTSQFCLNFQINCPLVLHTAFRFGVIFGVCINKCRHSWKCAPSPTDDIVLFIVRTVLTSAALNAQALNRLLMFFFILHQLENIIVRVIPPI